MFARGQIRVEAQLAEGQSGPSDLVTVRVAASTLTLAPKNEAQSSYAVTSVRVNKSSVMLTLSQERQLLQLRDARGRGRCKCPDLRYGSVVPGDPEEDVPVVGQDGCADT